MAMELYEVNGFKRWYNDGDAPAHAVRVKAKKTANKAKKASNKAKKTEVK